VTLTRAEAQALSPAELLTRLERPLPAELRELGPVALVEQLRADGLPVDALGVWIAAVGRALDAPTLSRDDAQALHQQLGLTARTPRFAAWAAALGPKLDGRPAVEALLELLVLANQLWRLGDVVRSRAPRE
jgi:hypothetical protein